MNNSYALCRLEKRCARHGLAIIFLFLLALLAGPWMTPTYAANISINGGSLELSGADYWSGTVQSNVADARLIAAGVTGAATQQTAGNGALLVMDPLTVITAGNGSVTVPDVTGQTQTAATTAITAAGLTVGTVTQQFHAAIPAGSVVSQSPAAGTSVVSGSAVNLTVSKGPSPAEGEGEGEPVTPPTVAEVQTQISTNFDTVDTNNDGQISYTEAVTTMPGLTQNVFNQLDTDASGTLSRTELGLAEPTNNSCGCSCAKSEMTLYGLKKHLGDLFLLGMSLMMLTVISLIKV